MFLWWVSAACALWDVPFFPLSANVIDHLFHQAATTTMASNARLAQVTRHLSPATNSAARSISTKVAKPPAFRSRADYKHFLPIQSRHVVISFQRWCVAHAVIRWSDNDQYGHINNSIYYFYIDTVVNEYLIRQCGLDPLDTTKTKPIGLVIASSANFYAPASYPNLLQAGLCITKIGRSSVTYRVGIFQGDEDQACVVGGFTHVFVDPIHRRPVKALPGNFKAGLEAIYVAEQ